MKSLGRYGGCHKAEPVKLQAALLLLEPLTTEERRQVINERPRTRAECADGPRPCPWASCRYHLGIEVGMNGTIVFSHEDFTEMPETCALDVADKGGVTLEEIGSLLGITRERVRQIEDRTLHRLSNRHSVPDPRTT